MKSQKFWNDLLKIDGITLDSELNEVNVKKGYCIGLTGYKCKNINDLKIAYKNIKSLSKNFNLKKYYCGYWFDKIGKVGYFDLTVIINNKSQALSIAKLFNQIAIFDLKTFTEITVNT